METWVTVPGYPRYQVSTHGRVKSLIGNHKILKPGKSKSGYLNVVLSNEEGKRTFRVHRLVALCHLPNPHNLPLVNHKDEDKAHNHVDNLEWCTEEYNLKYSRDYDRSSLSVTQGQKKVWLPVDL